MNVIGAGRTFLFAPNPHDKLHLWLVITDPDGQTDQVVAVMVCTAKTYTDSTVILSTGDHPFITHESSVHYSTATRFKVSAIQSAMKVGRCHLREDLKGELLMRVRQGLMDSPFTVGAIREYCAKLFDC
jgi:hypothetical protein